MKKLLLTLFAIITLTTLSFAQTQALSVQGGYSWTMGMVGVEYQYNYLAIGAGVMPTKMPMSDDRLTSFSAYLALVNYKPDKSGLYASFGFASQRYRYEESYDGGASWTNGMTAAMGIVNLGYRQHIYSGLNLRGDVGYGFCKYDNAFTWGATLGWTFKL